MLTTSKIRPAKVGRKGQATIEMALSLPFLIWLMYYTINAYHSLHSSHIAQKAAALNLHQRLGNRAQFAVDDVANTTVQREFMAVQYTDSNGQIPTRKILIGPTAVDNIVGICREPGCN